MTGVDCSDRTGLDLPRVTFGIIVLNGEPFTRYCLRSLYPYAHQIVVVEGGHEDAKAVTTPDGHSTDGTLEALARFKAEEDPLGKVEIVTRNDSRPKTDEAGRHRTHQSRAYAQRATGDYLWQVDIDEFYLPSQMESVLRMVAHDPTIPQCRSICWLSGEAWTTCMTAGIGDAAESSATVCSSGARATATPVMNLRRSMTFSAGTFATCTG